MQTDIYMLSSTIPLLLLNLVRVINKMLKESLILKIYVFSSRYFFSFQSQSYRIVHDDQALYFTYCALDGVAIILNE